MPAQNLGSIFQVGVDILKTTLSSTKLILAQIGDVVSKTVESDGNEWWQHVGFVSRPPEASPGVSASQAVAIERGDRNVIIASRDTRGASLSGSLQPGETCVYAAGDGTGQGRILLKADGSVSVYTTDGNVAGGDAVMINAKASDSSISLATKHGCFVIAEEGISIFHSGGSGIKIDENGVSLIGPTSQLISSQIKLGAGPIFDTVLVGATGMAGLPSLSVKASFP